MVSLKRTLFRACATVVMLIITASLFGQITVRSNTRMVVKGRMMIRGAVNNQSTAASLLAADVVLSGTNQMVSTSAPVELKTLTVRGGGTKTIQGNWEVREALTLESGVIHVPSSATFVYSGTAEPGGSDASYVTGNFTYSGSGKLFFPVGSASQYAPLLISNASPGNYSVRVVASDPAFSLPTDVNDYFPGHYWEFSAAPNATVALSLNGAQTFLQGNVPIVLQSGMNGGVSTSLSGTVSDNFVTSMQPASQVVVGIGIVPEFSLTIHDLITPFTIDEINDKLYIRNIELTSSNEVRLLDRYGVVVAKWSNYTNDTAFDFAQLSPGNYLCIVDYTSPGGGSKKSVKGMVTILKAN